ncbi:hypothetical protein [Streptomyces sp. NPDC050564]|uniref:hypothetical protein n=1 Tax=Streptomyces sp. NPDC050564 TaxID=3365631 RepID=UPI0037A13075
MMPLEVVGPAFTPSSRPDATRRTRLGRRSPSGADSLTYDQLYAEARRPNFRGRSSMNSAGLKPKLGR